MAVERQISGGRWRRLGGLLERANAVVRAIAQPSLTQLVLRFALAVPFWRSGVNKWDGFLQLNEVAVLLFSSEFQLHLPGRLTLSRRLRWWRSRPARRKSCCRSCSSSGLPPDWPPWDFW